MKWNKIEKKVNDLIEYDAGFKSISDENYGKLLKSVSDIGVVEPLIINTNNIIIDGNSRLKCLKELGVEDVICMVPERELSDKEHARAYIRKNKNIAGIDDYDILQQHFTQEEIDEYGVDIDIPEDFEIEDEKVSSKKYPYEVFCDTEEEKKEVKALIAMAEIFFEKKITDILTTK